MSHKEKDAESQKIVRITRYCALGVIIVWALTFLLFFMSDSEKRGQFGDMFGAVNALFSGLAFAGLIITLILQRRELSLQRDELEQTREELKNQREEFEKENETLRQQRFENLFYNMLNLQQEIVAGLRFEYDEEQIVTVPIGPDNSLVQDKRKINRVVTGREVFRYTFESAEIYLAERDRFNQRIVVSGYRGYLNNEGLSAYDETWIPTIFDHYFRHLYKIIQFVDAQGFSFAEAYKYIALLRGTLSRYELVWIYYNALNPGFHKFQELIEKYSLLKNMRTDLLTRCKEVGDYYKYLGVTPQEVKDATFSGRDFEYFLTDDKQDAEKYYVTAFWKEDEKGEGLEWLKRWRIYVDDVGKVGKTDVKMGVNNSPMDR